MLGLIQRLFKSSPEREHRWLQKRFNKIFVKNKGKISIKKSLCISSNEPVFSSINELTSWKIHSIVLLQSKVIYRYKVSPYGSWGSEGLSGWVGWVGWVGRIVDGAKRIGRKCNAEKNFLQYYTHQTSFMAKNSQERHWFPRSEVLYKWTK